MTGSGFVHYVQVARVGVTGTVISNPAFNLIGQVRSGQVGAFASGATNPGRALAAPHQGMAFDGDVVLSGIVVNAIEGRPCFCYFFVGVCTVPESVKVIESNSIKHALVHSCQIATPDCIDSRQKIVAYVSDVVF